MVERSDRMWSTGEGNGKPLQYSCLENAMNSMKKRNDRILKEELPMSIGAQYATGDQWRNNSRKNEDWFQIGKGVAITVNKRVQNAVLGCNLKNNRMISVHFQGKPFNITVIQAYAPTSNAEDAEAEAEVL